MPIGEFEREILRRIARNRNPDSFAGATVLHQSATSPRASRDVDVFQRHDGESGSFGGGGYGSVAVRRVRSGVGS